MNTLVLIIAGSLLTIIAGVAACTIGLREAADPRQSRWRHLTDWEKDAVAQERAERRVGMR